MSKSAIEKELNRVRKQKRDAIAALQRLVETLNVFIPVGFYGGETETEDGIAYLREMVQGIKKAPLIIKSENLNDIKVYWTRDLAGQDPYLAIAQGNLKGWFADGGAEAIAREASPRFFVASIIPSFADDVASEIERAVNAD